MTRLPRPILSISAVAAVLIPLHLLTFGQPAPDPRIAWLISERPLYRQEFIDNQEWAVPNPHVIFIDGENQKKFLAAKAPGAYRIFCIGQSTTEGYPFYPRAGYPEWLGHLLKDVLPNRRVQVINAGVSGSDSTRDLAIVKEVLKYHPDLFVLYEGNNEQLYGHLRLLQNKMGNRFGRLLFWLRGYFPIMRLAAAHLSEPSPKPAALMPLYERNIREMIRLAERRSIRVVLLGQINIQILASRNSPPPYNRFLSTQQNKNAAFIDTRRFFKNAGDCRQFVPECLIDYVHPSLRGQWLIARAIAHGLYKRGWIAPPRQWRWMRVRSKGVYSEALGVTKDFLAEAFVREAEGLGDDSGKLGDLSYYISAGEGLEKGVFLRALADRPGRFWSPALKKAILDYYDRAYPEKARELRRIILRSF
ncbi:MAG TPA: GDSL-type esterase/lipase family protein [Elusimicrobiota bacterium]|nr:GDSL-type esterase/lipase family protein [Elusimicrobiota bacterium]